MRPIHSATILADGSARVTGPTGEHSLRTTGPDDAREQIIAHFTRAAQDAGASIHAVTTDADGTHHLQVHPSGIVEARAPEEVAWPPSAAQPATALDIVLDEAANVVPTRPDPSSPRGLARLKRGKRNKTDATPPGQQPAIISAPPGWPLLVAPASATPFAEVAENLDETRLARPHAPAPQIVFDTGEVVVVTGLGLAGRNPSATATEIADHLVTVVDPARSVSKTHIAFGLDADGLWFADRGSTNGTVVIAPDGFRTQLLAGVRTYVAPGTVIEFGDRSVHYAVPSTPGGNS